MTIRQIWNWIIEQAAGIADVATFQVNWLDAPIGSVIGAVILYSTVVWSMWLEDRPNDFLVRWWVYRVVVIIGLILWVATRPDGEVLL